jgi:hypothetical protein
MKIVFASGNKNKLQNCDLLEVYTDAEKEKLKISVNLNWSTFIENDDKNSFTSKSVAVSTESFTFGDAKTIEYQELMSKELSKPIEKREIVGAIEEEEINIDDI